MKPLYSIAIASGIALALGATVAFSPSATSGPFGGSEPATCGAGLDCSSDTYTATASSGSGYACNSALATCVDLGPGANNGIGTNASGHILLGPENGTSTIVKVNDTVTIEAGSAQFTNMDVKINNNACLVDPTNDVDVCDADGITINDTTPIKGILVVAVTIDIPAIAAACDEITTTVAGVNANDAVFITPDFDMTVEVQVANARVTNAVTDEVKFLACDPSGGGLDPASGSYLFLVMRK